MTKRLAILVASMAALAGCAADSSKLDLGDLIEDGDASKADFFSERVRVQGTIAYGNSVQGNFLTAGFAGYTFTGARNARITAELIGDGRNDPMLYLYGPKVGSDWTRARSVARNDDSNGTQNSRIDVRLPSDGTYLLLVREYTNSATAYTLTLGCNGSECRAQCRSNSACPEGSVCERIYCVRAPCPSFCAPIPEERPCGGIAGLACGEGQYCEYAADAMCGAADRTGICRPRPTVCTREFAPVCGCNGETYSNACNARAAGVSVAYEGACADAGECTAQECGPRPQAPNFTCDDGVTVGGPGACVRDENGECGWTFVECPAPRTCGGRSGNRNCTEDEFCNFGPQAECGRGDRTGSCAPIPTVCTREFAPVCGCDGRTYSNRCSANAAGVSVERDGACDAPCRVGGCSGQLCVGPESNGISTCEWRPEYACYRGATCERQADGQCGWTQTPELQMCLNSSR